MKPRAGDQYLLPLVTTTDGHLAKDVTVTIERVEHLGCTCTRLATTRPGPADGGLSPLMHLHVDRCPFHQLNPPDGGAGEPDRLT